MKKFFTGIAIGIFIILIGFNIFVVANSPGKTIPEKFQYLFQGNKSNQNQSISQKLLNEESVAVDVVNRVGPSVVTVGIKKTQTVFEPFNDFFDPFGIFQRRNNSTTRQIEQNIGSGFIVSSDGLVVTNKHVVADTNASYRVFMSDNKLYEVQKIYRDSTTDLAILKIDAPANILKPVEMGDSSKLKVGQYVIAIGTALGEFRNTVTTGVISGLGRGIVAGSPFEGSENLDNVIQTDAAINPGNSGGPLLNSLGQVVGVNVAVAQEAQGIGFALPINVIRDSLDNFNKTGKFSRPFLGIKYRMIDQKEAIAKGWVEGAGVVEVVLGSPAEKSGIKAGDIIYKVNGEKLSAKKQFSEIISEIISNKKVGDELKLTIWRDNQDENITVRLQEAQ